MSVTVDREPLAARQLNLHTVGQVLSHIQKDNKLVVQLLIDGQEPAAGQLTTMRQLPLDGRTLYIETADPRSLALEVLDEVTRQINEADPHKAEAADLLLKNQAARAMEKLSICIRAWQHAQESVVKIAELLRINLAGITIGGNPLTAMLNHFSDQLRQIRSALEQRDFVCLGDVLLYETAETSRQWQRVLEVMRRMVLAIA